MCGNARAAAIYHRFIVDIPSRTAARTKKPVTRDDDTDHAAVAIRRAEPATLTRAQPPLLQRRPLG